MGTISDLHADKNAEIDAQQITIILKSILQDSANSQLTEMLGTAIAQEKRTLAVQKAGTEWVLGGEVRRTGGHLFIQLFVVDTDGNIVEEEVLQVPVGDMQALSEGLSTLVERLTHVIRKQNIPMPSSSLESLANAYQHLLEKDWQKAADSLLSVRRRVTMKKSEAIAIAREILAAPSVDPETRLLVALSIWDLDQADSVVKNAPLEKKAELQAILDSRVALGSGDTKITAKSLSKYKESQSPGILQLRAEYAYSIRSEKKLSAIMSMILDNKNPPLPTLGWIVGLAPGVFSNDIEEKIYKTAKTLEDQHSALRSSLLARARTAGISLGNSWKHIDGFRVDKKHLATLKEFAVENSTKDDLEGLRIVAEIAQRSADTKTAKASLARALVLDPENSKWSNAIMKLESAPPKPTVQPQFTRFINDTSKEDKGKKVTELTRDLVDELNTITLSLPGLNISQKVLIIQHQKSGESWWSPRQVKEQLLADALAQSMSVHRKASGVQSQESIETLTESALKRQMNKYRATAAIIYQLHAKGGNAHLKLTFFDRDSQELLVLEEILDSQLGLVKWNPIYVVFVSLLFLALVLWAIRLIILGKGHLSVRLELPNTNDRVCIRLTREKTVPNMKAQMKMRNTKTRSNLVSRRNEFRGLLSGTWYVHIFGTYERLNEQIALAPQLAAIKISRNTVTSISLDMIPKIAQLKLLVLDGSKPLTGVRVSILGNELGVTDKEGRATLSVPVGCRSIHIASSTEAWDISIHAAEPQSYTRTVNAERLRREEEYQEGIEIEGIVTNVPFTQSIITDQVATIQGNEPRSGHTSTPSSQEHSDATVPGSIGLSRYETLCLLGEGAMGSVVKATDKVLDRLVAVKVMTRELDNHPEARKLFLTEAKALAALNHPNIVTVFDQGNDKGKLFIVMEFVEGQTLEEKLKNGPLTIKESMEIGHQLAKALAYAHEKRVIHRDIKPANIFITNDGNAKIGDFGLARVVNEVMIKKTAIKGTPLYMAPEQITGMNIDFRADIYALGCLLFETVSGRPPFIDGEVLYHHMHTPPPSSSQFNTQMSPAYDLIITQCLQKEADNRFKSAAELRYAIEEIR